ncbi:MAG: hypothetical protein KAS32_06860 [Candidatus Peribacteraceae bacterium]|nr:hypothetical protein [Candidatus Peribacteraceae bacterium]
MAQGKSSIFSELWRDNSENLLEFTDREKEIYNSPLFLNAISASEKACSILHRINKHPLLACCLVNFPSSIQVRVRKQSRVAREIFAGAMKLRIIGTIRTIPNVCKSVKYEISFIKGFDSNNEFSYFDIEDFVCFIESLVEKKVNFSPSDLIINKIVGEVLKID